MTNYNTNVARPEGYSAAEKLLSWARLGWRHVGFFGFVFLAIITVASIDITIDESVLMVISREAKDAEDCEKYDRFVREFAAYPVTVLLGLTGVLVDKYIGRFYGLILTLFVAVLGSILMYAANPGAEGAVALYTLSSWYGIPAVLTIAAIYCYESVPLKFRLIAVSSLTLGETMGKVVMSLVDKMMAEKKTPLEIWDMRRRNLAIVPSVLFVITVAVGFLFNKKDTPLSNVNARSRAGLVFDQLAKEGIENTTEPIPMTRDEFEANTKKDLERLGSLRTLWGIVKRALIGPVAVIAGVWLAFMILRKVHSVHYYFVTVDYLGDGYARNYIPMMLLEHGTAIAGVLLSMGLWVWMKDIRYVPAAGLLFAALGFVVCASVEVKNAEGYPYTFQEIGDSMTKVTSGVTMVLIGQPLAMSLFRVITLDLFTTENRATGAFGVRIIESVFSGAVSALELKFRTEHTFLIICASVVMVIGASIFAIFYTTQWFEHSLVFRDPELDACWLISSQQASRPVVGSREKLNRDSSTLAGSSSLR